MGINERLFERGCRVIPGGVNSPVRAFRSVGGTPVYMQRGQGSKLWTEDGRELVDLCGSWGPLILGHARPEVLAAISAAAAQGTSFGACTRIEVDFAEQIRTLIPYAEQVRLMSSGTEAVMTALRLARGVTGRRRIIKFDGGYHGHSDGLLVSAGSGLLNGASSSSAGVPAALAAEVFVPHYNDLTAVNAIVDTHGKELAAIIVEPVAGNMGLVAPAPGFLNGLRQAANRCGAILIFDEVITGFRLGAGTYGSLCGVTPDLTCLGKIIGGGMPVGAVCGPRHLMEQLAPLGPVYQAGTLSGNPVCVAAGMATLEILVREQPWPRLAALGRLYAEAFTAAATEHGVQAHAAVLGGMVTPFFCAGPVRNLAEARQADTKQYARFFHGMLERGFYLPPAQFEASFISAAHTEAEIQAAAAAAREVLQEIARTL
jgi:glutamate-1-semialdehyde 2,1-aminomutase